MTTANELVQETQDTVTDSVMNETAENEKQEFIPIFDEIQELNPGGAVNVLIQAAQQAQAAGALTLRDSVVVAQAINVLRPGSI